MSGWGEFGRATCPVCTLPIGADEAAVTIDDGAGGTIPVHEDCDQGDDDA